MAEEEPSKEITSDRGEIEMIRQSLGDRRSSVNKTLLTIDRHIQLLGERKTLLDKLEANAVELQKIDSNQPIQFPTN